MSSPMMTVIFSGDVCASDFEVAAAIAKRANIHSLNVLMFLIAVKTPELSVSGGNILSIHYTS
jgi:hypothetical protein